MRHYPLLIAFPPGTSLRLEQHRDSALPILGNGPPGTFVLFPAQQLMVSLPTDQVVFAEVRDGHAEVAFGGMQFAGIDQGRLVFTRVRELHPEAQLSPARSHVMLIEPHLVSAVHVDGELVWPPP